MSNIVSVGIDPGVGTTAVVATSGDQYFGTAIIKPEEGLPENVRYLNIAEQVLNELGEMSPDIIGIEGFSLQSRGAGVSKMYGVGWAIRFVMMYNQYEFSEVPPSTWKKYVGGKARKRGATKKQLSEAVNERWDFNHPVQDAHDAYAISRLMYEYRRGTLSDTDTHLAIHNGLRANVRK